MMIWVKLLIFWLIPCAIYLLPRKEDRSKKQDTSAIISSEEPENTKNQTEEQHFDDLYMSEDFDIKDLIDASRRNNK